MIGGEWNRAGEDRQSSLTSPFQGCPLASYRDNSSHAYSRRTCPTNRTDVPLRTSTAVLSSMRCSIRSLPATSQKPVGPFCNTRAWTFRFASRSDTCIPSSATQAARLAPYQPLAGLLK
jgi:hypothetical protein